jgi:hypothetical protein
MLTTCVPLLLAVDKNYCSSVKDYGLHGWWHVFVAMGVYTWIQFASAKSIRDEQHEFMDEGLLATCGLPFGDILPLIVPKKQAS